MEDTIPTRPKTIYCAVCLLCAAGAIDVLAAYLQGEAVAEAWILFAVIVALCCVVMRGYFWVRGALLLMCALRFMAMVCEFIAPAKGPVLLLGAVSTLLYIVASDCLFHRPAFLWFNDMREERNS